MLKISNYCSQANIRPPHHTSPPNSWRNNQLVNFAPPSCSDGIFFKRSNFTTDRLLDKILRRPAGVSFVENVPNTRLLPPPPPPPHTRCDGRRKLASQRILSASEGAAWFADKPACSARHEKLAVCKLPRTGPGRLFRNHHHVDRRGAIFRGSCIKWSFPLDCLFCKGGTDHEKLVFDHHKTVIIRVKF